MLLETGLRSRLMLLLSLLPFFQLFGQDLGEVQNDRFVVPRVFVSLDIGADPAGLWGSWGPVISARVRTSKSIPDVDNLSASVCLEYWQYRLHEEFATGMKFILEGTDVKRHDFKRIDAAIRVASVGTW